MAEFILEWLSVTTERETSNLFTRFHCGCYQGCYQKARGLQEYKSGHIFEPPQTRLHSCPESGVKFARHINRHVIVKQHTPSNTARTARRVRMAKAAIAGKSVTEIARNEERSRGWVGRELATSETHHFLTELVNIEQEDMLRLFRKVKARIDEALDAEKKVTAPDGKVISVEPDHTTRLAACKRFMELVSIGRPMPKPKQRGTLVTLEELEAMLQQREEEEAKQAGAATWPSKPREATLFNGPPLSDA
jgi:hypothetical protein